MFSIHQDKAACEELTLGLDEIARQGARRMLAEALEVEVEAYIEAAKDQRDERGRALVVRNGRARCREILCGAGAVEVRAPRVNDKRVDEDGERRRFKSVILPPYVRRSPKVTEVLPLLYLHGLSSGDFIEGFGGVLRYRRWTLGLDHHPPHEAVASLAGELHGARPLVNGELVEGSEKNEEKDEKDEKDAA